MDRRSFIINTAIVNSCNEEHCECADSEQPKKQLEKVNSFHVIVIVSLALLCATFFTMFKSYGTEEDSQLLLAKRETIIGCGVNMQTDFNDKKKPERNNGNACSHLQPCSLCETSNSKRRSIKMHSC